MFPEMENPKFSLLRHDAAESTIYSMKATAEGIVDDNHPYNPDALNNPDNVLDLGSNGDLIILRAETPSEIACSVLECGLLWWPSRVRKLIFTTDPFAPVFGADEIL